MKYLYYIILPGLQYTTECPIWVDKIIITAQINGKACKISPVTENGIQTSRLEDKIVLERADFAETADGNIHSIYPKSDVKQVYQNTEGLSTSGLAAVLFTGSLTDTCVFHIKLYTRTDWVETDDKYTLSNIATYALIHTEEIQYNPFISIPQAPKLVTGDWVDQKIELNSEDIQSTIKSACLVIPPDAANSEIYLDKNIDVCLPYDQLPLVRIVATNGTYKACAEQWQETFLDDLLNKLPDLSHYYFLPFNQDLSDIANKDIAICAYRKSVNGSVGRQRFSIVGVETDDFQLDDPIRLPYKIEYDFSKLQDFEYFTSIKPEVSISFTPNWEDFTVKFNQPDELYSQSANTYSLNSGCAWSVLDNAGITEESTFDIWNDFSNIRDRIWTVGANRGSTIPNTTNEPTISDDCVSIGSINLTISNSEFKNTQTVNVDIHSLKDVKYITFVDNGYSKRKFSDLVFATTQLQHDVENGYIEVVHQPTTVNITCIPTNTKPEITLSSDTYTSNQQFIPYLVAQSTDEAATVYSYTIADSLAGGMKINEIVDYKMVENNDIKPYDANGSLDTAPEDQCYILDAGKSLTLQSKGNIIKYTKLILDKDNKINWSEMQYENMFQQVIDGSCTITSDTKCIIGAIAALNAPDAIVDGKIDFTKLSLPHAFGCYEDVQLFNEYSFNKVYFPPKDYFCIGFYKIVSTENKIKEENIKWLYKYPHKQQILLNLIDDIQYRRTKV